METVAQLKQSASTNKGLNTSNVELGADSYEQRYRRCSLV